MKVVIGAGKTAYDGWISTQETELNLLNPADFERLFADERPTAFLAEHVWEHMSFEEGCRAAANCFAYLPMRLFARGGAGQKLPQRVVSEHGEDWRKRRSEPPLVYA